MAATYDNLPVFKLCYDLLFQVIGWGNSMAKDFRYTIAEDLKKQIVRMEVLIYRANKSVGVDKASHIAESLEVMVEVKLYLRILNDSKQITVKQFAHVCEHVAMIEKHLSNWLKYVTAEGVGGSPNTPRA